MKTNIILIGMRGSGKSTIGRILASNLGKPLIETDALIEKETSLSISDFVEKNGWAAFRTVEKKICQRICQTTQNAVIATGGGIILDSENREALKKCGLLIYLKTDLETLIARIKHKKNRPMLSESKNIEDDLRRVFDERKKLYEETSEIISEDNNFLTVNKETTLCAIFGRSVSYSLSPNMHMSGYQKLGLNYVFLKLSAIDASLIPIAIRLLRIKGSAITVPFKETVMEYLDQIDETTKKIGAVNTVVLQREKLHGTNTDWIGGVEALEEKTKLLGKTVAVLGAGGAARAISYGLKKRGATVYIFNRTKSNAEKLVKELQLEGAFGLSEYTGSKHYDILINATQVGMDSHSSPVSKDAVLKNQIVFDIVYSPKSTKLLQYAKDAGATCITGNRLLLHQGTVQFELFTGMKAPIADLEDVLC